MDKLEDMKEIDMSNIDISKLEPLNFKISNDDTVDTKLKMHQHNKTKYELTIFTLILVFLIIVLIKILSCMYIYTQSDKWYINITFNIIFFICGALLCLCVLCVLYFFMVTLYYYNDKLSVSIIHFILGM